MKNQNKIEKDNYKRTEKKMCLTCVGYLKSGHCCNCKWKDIEPDEELK